MTTENKRLRKALENPFQRALLAERAAWERREQKYPYRNILWSAYQLLTIRRSPVYLQWEESGFIND